jgi:citronellol/citronellal dehydrogenase
MTNPLHPLQGKTVFITGASRGIGRAIALRFAADGASIAIAAKTSDPHSTLPGTIHSVAAEITALGGTAVPLQVDVRDEGAIETAISHLVERFGAIDVLVNNASAITLTNMEDTPIRRYDLLMAVNLRGTYVCTRACLPHLKQASNPHVLTISPPLPMHPRWYGKYPAHAISKAGMTMCTLGVAEAYREIGIAANSLWPRTLIATAAAEVFFPEQIAACRQPEIMADAAYAIVTKDSREITGNCFVDEDVLRAEGVVDFDRYSSASGTALATDLYLE